MPPWLAAKSRIRPRREQPVRDPGHDHSTHRESPSRTQPPPGAPTVTTWLRHRFRGAKPQTEAHGYHVVWRPPPGRDVRSTSTAPAGRDPGGRHSPQ